MVPFYMVEILSSLYFYIPFFLIPFGFSSLALISFAQVNDFFHPNQVIPYLFKIICAHRPRWFNEIPNSLLTSSSHFPRFLYPPSCTVFLRLLMSSYFIQEFGGDFSCVTGGQLEETTGNMGILSMRKFMKLKKKKHYQW